MFIGRPAILLTVLATVSGTALLIALASGSADISLAEMLAGLRGDASDKVQDVVINLRLPRALTAFAVGGLLAVAGVLMQVLLRNPLAEPYILGTSGGAAVAALLAATAPALAYDPWGLMPEAASAEAEEIDALTYVILWITGVTFVIVEYVDEHLGTGSFYSNDKPFRRRSFTGRFELIESQAVGTRC